MLVLNKLPALVRSAVAIADATDYTREEAYGILKDVYAPQVEVIEAWRDWLVEEYIPAHQTHSRGKIYLKGPCLSIRIDDKTEAQLKKDVPDAHPSRNGSPFYARAEAH